MKQIAPMTPWPPSSVVAQGRGQRLPAQCTLTHWLTDCLPACLFPVRGSPTRLQGSSGTLAYERPIVNLFTHSTRPTHLLEDLGSAAHRHDVGWARLSWFLHCSSPHRFPHREASQSNILDFFFSQAGNTLPSLETWNRERLTADSHSEELRKELSEPVLKMFQNQRTAGSTQCKDLAELVLWLSFYKYLGTTVI
jgi:hypothetical protein